MKPSSMLTRMTDELYGTLVYDFHTSFSPRIRIDGPSTGLSDEKTITVSLKQPTLTERYPYLLARLAELAARHTWAGKRVEVSKETFEAAIYYGPKVKRFRKDGEIRNILLRALDAPYTGHFFRWLAHLGALHLVSPEHVKGIGCTQNDHHRDSVFEHLCLATDKAASYPPLLKLAVFFHDVGKPHTKDIKNGKITFYSHEVAGVDITINTLLDLGFSYKDAEYVASLVRHHQFHFDVYPKRKTIRRWMGRIGPDNWRSLILLRIADRRGNRRKSDRPIITDAIRSIIYHCRAIERSNIPYFKRDLAISDEDILSRLDRRDISREYLEEIYQDLLCRVISNSEKNNQDYLLSVVEERYGDTHNETQQK